MGVLTKWDDLTLLFLDKFGVSVNKVAEVLGFKEKKSKTAEEFNLEKLIETCERTLQTDPQDFYARANLASCYIEKGELTDAEAELKKCWKIIGKKPVYMTVFCFVSWVDTWSPKQWEINKLEGRIHLTRNELDEAEKCFKAVTGRVTDVNAENLLATVYFNKGEFGKMIYRLKPIAHISKHRVDVEFNLGLGYFHMQNYEEAQTHFKKAIKSNSRDKMLGDDFLMQACSLAGHSLVMLSRYKEARPFLEKALEIQPNLQQAIFNLGLVTLFHDHETEMAQELFYKFLTLLPEGDLADQELAKEQIGLTHFMQLINPAASKKQVTSYAASRHRVFKVEPKEREPPQITIKIFNDRESLLTDARATNFYFKHAQQYSLNMPKLYRVIDNKKIGNFSFIMQQITGPELLELMLLKDPGFLSALGEANLQLARMHELSLYGSKELQMEDVLYTDPTFFIKRFFEKFLDFYGINLTEKEKQVVISGLRAINRQLWMAKELAHYEDANLRNWRKADKVYTFDHESCIVKHRLIHRVVRSLKLPSLIDLINLYEFGADYLSEEQKNHFMKQYMNEREAVGQRQLHIPEFYELYPHAGFFRHRELCGYRKRDSTTENDVWMLDAQGFHIRRSRQLLSTLIPEEKPVAKDKLLRFENLLEEKIDPFVLNSCSH